MKKRKIGISFLRESGKTRASFEVHTNLVNFFSAKRESLKNIRVLFFWGLPFYDSFSLRRRQKIGAKRESFLFRVHSPCKEENSFEPTKYFTMPVSEIASNDDSNTQLNNCRLSRTQKIRNDCDKSEIVVGRFAAQEENL